MPETLLLEELQVCPGLMGEPVHQKDLHPQGAVPSCLTSGPSAEYAQLTGTGGLPLHASGPQLVEQQVGAVVVDDHVCGHVGQIRIIEAQPLAVALAHVCNVVPC